jgi:outer membrane receptor protein involved in Fe transport
MKKLALLLASISLVGMNLYAGELKSFTSEAVMNDLDSGKEHLELTIGKGSYQLNDNFKFIFDVDKDFITNANGTKQEGWDTQFGLVQDLGKVKGFDVSLNYLLRYDDRWDTTSHEKAINGLTQYIVSPYFNKDLKLAGKDFSFGTELWAQVGGEDGQSLENAAGGEVNFYLSGALSEKWNLDLSLYNWNYYSADADKYEYTVGTENTLAYNLPLKGGLSFNIDNYLYATYNTNTETDDVEIYIRPKVKYTKELSDIKVYGAIAYEVLSYEDTKTWTNNEFELTLGFKTK